jgi:hypothetical protein
MQTTLISTKEVTGKQHCKIKLEIYSTFQSNLISQETLSIENFLLKKKRKMKMKEEEEENKREKEIRHDGACPTFQLLKR